MPSAMFKGPSTCASALESAGASGARGLVCAGQVGKHRECIAAARPRPGVSQVIWHLGVHTVALSPDVCHPMAHCFGCRQFWQLHDLRSCQPARESPHHGCVGMCWGVKRTRTWHSLPCLFSLQIPIVSDRVTWHVSIWALRRGVAEDAPACSPRT